MSWKIEINCNKCNKKIWSHSGGDSTEISTARFSYIFKSLSKGNECTDCIIEDLKNRKAISENGLGGLDLINDITIPENQW